jgi:nucleoside recognition membrane protein YjiH
MNKIIIGGIVTIVVGLTLTATIWNFTAVAEMPEKYVTIEDNKEEHKSINDKLDYLIKVLIKGRR